MNLCSKFGSASLHRPFGAFAILFAALIVVPQSLPTGSLALVCATPTSSAQESEGAAVDAALSEAERALEGGGLDEALAKCREALKLDPESARAYYLVGIIETQRGNEEDARSALLHSIKLDPSHIATHVDLGKLYLLSKEWRAAQREFQTALKLGDATGASEFGLGLALAGESRASEALPHLAIAVRADPKNPEKLFTLVAAELQVKQVANAERHVTELEKLSPRDPWLFHRLGNLLKQYRMLDEAEAMLERSAGLLAAGESVPPPQALTLSDLSLEIAWVRFEQHDYAGALQALEKVDLATAPSKDRARALDLQGEAWLAAGKIDEARERLRQAAEINPSEPEYVLHRAWAELMAGDLETATTVATAAKSRWPQAPEVALLLAVVGRERAPARARVSFTADWHLKGKGLVCCPCTVPCPCRSNGPPTNGHCENTGVFRIAQGHYGNIPLDGLTFAAVDAAMGQEGVPSTVYANASATDEQLIALERIFQTFKPLKPSLFLNVKRVPLALVSPDEKSYEANIPGLLEIKIRRELDDKGRPLMETAAVDYFSNRLEYARSLIYKAWDPEGGLRWDYSGRQANFRTIDLDARDYRERTMLIQFGDGSGFFTKKQLELIKSLKLPTLASYPKASNSASQ